MSMEVDRRSFRSRRLSYFHARARASVDQSTLSTATEDMAQLNESSASESGFERKVHTEQQRQWLQFMTRQNLEGLSAMLRKDPSILLTTELYTGSCALHYAARKGDIEMLQVLLQGNYQPALDQQNFAGNTPLHVAYANNINNRNSALVEHLKVLGASENVMNHSGLVPAEMERKAYRETKLLPLVQLEREKKKEAAKTTPAVVETPGRSPLTRRPTLRESVGKFFRGRRNTGTSKGSGSRTSFRLRSKTATDKAASAASLVSSPMGTPQKAGALFSPPPGEPAFKFKRSYTFTGASPEPDSPPRATSPLQRDTSSRASKAKFG